MIHIIADFSKTFTKSDKPTTWSALAVSGLLGDTYIQKRNQLFNENYHYELAGDIQKTHDWFAAHLQLMIDSGLTQKHISSLVKDPSLFAAREGLKRFTYFCYTHNIPITIISSGISNFISAFLEYQNINTEHITVIGNTLTSDSIGNITGYDPGTVFCPLKSKAQFKTCLDISENDTVFLLGDKPEDLEMYKKAYKTIGFNQEYPGFDMNLGTQGDLSMVIGEIQKIL